MSQGAVITVAYSPSEGGAETRRPRWMVLLALIWLVALGVVVQKLVRFDDQRPATGPVLAHVSQAVGNVKARADASILWDDARSGWELRKGDVVATGKDGYALVDFPGGRRFVLGPNSMIGIEEEADQGVGTGHLQLVLLKGQVAASMTEPRKPPEPASPAIQAFDKIMASLNQAQTEPKIVEPLSIQSGGQVFDLETRLDSTLALSKAPNHPARVIPAEKVPPPPVVQPKTVVASAAPQPVAAPAPLAVLQSVPVLSREIILPKPVAEPPAAVLAIPKVAIKKVVVPPKIATFTPPKPDPHMLDPLIIRVQSSVLLTGVSLKTQCPEAKDLLIPIGPRFHLAPSTIWRPFIEFRPAGAPTFRMYGQDQILRQFVKMPMAQICGTAPEARKGDSFTVELVPGHLASGEIPESMASNAPTKLILASLADLPEKPVTLHFDKLELGSTMRSRWLAFSRAKAEKYRIRVKGKQQLEAMWPLFSGQGRVALSGLSVDGDGSQIHFHDKGGWLATMRAPAVDKAQVRLLQKMLDADMAFTGPQSGFVRLPRVVKQRLNLIEENLRSDQEIYLLVRDRVVKVTLADLKADPQSVIAVGQSATAFFRKGTEPILP